MAKTTSESIAPTAVNGQPVAPAEEPVAPQVTVVEDDLVEIELFHTFVNNYTIPEATALGIKLDAQGRQVFGPGKHKVDRATADDLMRRQMAVIQSEKDLITAHNLTSGSLGHFG